MSKYSLTQDQINLLSYEEIETLRLQISQEMSVLADTEYKLYRRRRELEHEQNPQAFEFLDQEPNHKPKTKPSTITPEQLINAAKQQNINLTELINKVFTK